MNTNLKIALALAVLVAAVAGITVITQYTEPEAKPPAGPTGGGATGGSPLVYADTTLYYDPASDNYAKRVFAGFFEVNAEVHWATYLLRNERAVPVQLSARSRSCTACSQARVAVLPAADNRQLGRDAQPLFAAAVGGLHPAAPDTAVYRRAESGNSLAWQQLDFDHPDKTIEVPPAANPSTPTWCVLQLGFEVKQTGIKTLAATIGMATADLKTPVEQQFTVGFFGDAAERVNPALIEFGTLAERSEPVSRELFYWSATRPPAGFAPPKVAGTDPFLSASAPVALTPAELDVLARRASSKDVAVRARAGYKLTLTLRRDNPTAAPGAARELDIGPVEKTLTVAGSDGTTGGQSVRLTGNVTGLVALSGGAAAVELGDFPQKTGTSKEFKLTSDRLDLELEPVNGGDGEARDRNPAGVTVTAVGKPVDVNARRQWTFNLAAAPDALGGDLSARLLVFRVKGTGQLVRLPLRGYGYTK